jgi:MFS superfamily sulfate permease-like transporter
MVPQALAYALLAGMPPMNGLYTAFWPVLMYAFMGHSRQLSLGPDALVSTLFGAAVELAPEHPLVLAQCLGLLVALMLLVLGLLRLGFLDVILSRPLLAGFVNAVAVEIIMEQSPNLFGIATPKGVHGWHKVGYLIEHQRRSATSRRSLALLRLRRCCSSRVVKTVLKKRWPNAVLFPELLLVAGLNIGLSWGLGLSTEGLLTLGKMGSGFSEPTLPQFEKIDIDVSELFRVVLVITMIGFVESIVAAKIFADKHNYSVSANRELVAYGPQQRFRLVLWRVADVWLAAAHRRRRHGWRHVARLLGHHAARRARHDPLPRPVSSSTCRASAARRSSSSPPSASSRFTTSCSCGRCARTRA